MSYSSNEFNLLFLVQMLCHLVSTDPNNYSTVKFTSQAISKANTSVIYRINSVSFIANFSITTSDDYLVIEYQNTLHRISFPDKGIYNLAYDLKSLLSSNLEGFNCNRNDRGLLEITGPEVSI